MSPEEAGIQDSTLYQPTINESKSMLKMDFSAGQGYFGIAIFTLLVIIILLGLSYCNGCTPAKLARKKEEREWKMEIKELMQRNNQLEMEEGLEAEGWVDVGHKGPNNGSGPKGQPGLPRLVEGA